VGSFSTDLLIEAAIAASKTDRVKIAIGWLQQVRSTKPLTQKILDAVRFEVRLLESEGNAPEAIELASEFSLEVEKRSLIARTQEVIGRKQYADGEFAESLETFATLLKLKDTDTNQQMVWRYFEALNYIGLKKFEAAEKSLGRISDDFSDETLIALVKFCKASVKFRLEKYEAAIPYFQQYLKHDLEKSDRQSAMQELAICYAKTKNAQGADLQLDSLVGSGKSTPGGIDADLESIVELVAESASQADKKIAEKWYQYLKQNSWDDDRRLRADSWLLVKNFAILWHQLALENSSPTNAKLVGGVRIKIAKLAYQLGGESNLMTAKSALEAWLTSDPKGDAAMTPEVLFQLAWVNHDLGDLNKSLKNFDQLARTYPTSKYWPDAAYRVAKQNVSTKDYPGAKVLLDKILAKQELPAEIRARSNFLVGKIAFANQDWHSVESAMQAFMGQTADDNARLTAQYFLAESLFQQKKNMQATELFNQLHQTSDTLPKQYQPWVWLRKASLQLVNGDAIGAAKNATEAKVRFYDFGSRYEFDFLIARGLETEGLLSDAREQFEKVITSATGNQTETAACSQWRIGETYFHQENYKSAIAEYYKVDSLYAYPKWRAAALIQAGKCQEHLANPKNASKLYQKLLSRYPESELAAEARARMDKLDFAAVERADTKSAKRKTANQLEHTKY